MKLADATPHLEALYITECRHRNLCFANLCSELCTKLTQLRYLRWEECKKVSFIFWFSISEGRSNHMVAHQNIKTNLNTHKLSKKGKWYENNLCLSLRSRKHGKIFSFPWKMKLFCFNLKYNFIILIFWNLIPNNSGYFNHSPKLWLF